MHGNETSPKHTHAHTNIVIYHIDRRQPSTTRHPPSTIPPTDSTTPHLSPLLGLAFRVALSIALSLFALAFALHGGGGGDRVGLRGMCGRCTGTNTWAWKKSSDSDKYVPHFYRRSVKKHC
jgi:hypothetical protein